MWVMRMIAFYVIITSTKIRILQNMQLWFKIVNNALGRKYMPLLLECVNTRGIQTRLLLNT